MSESDLDKARAGADSTSGYLTAADFDIFSGPPDKVDVQKVLGAQDQAEQFKPSEIKSADEKASDAVSAETGDRTIEDSTASIGQIRAYKDDADMLARHVGGGNDMSNGMGSNRVKDMLDKAAAKGPTDVIAAVEAINKALQANPKTAGMKIEVEKSSNTFTLNRPGKEPDKYQANSSSGGISNSRLRR